MTKIRFPKFDANVLEGQVGEWIKEVGDRVAEEDPLVELITDKATFDLPSEGSGILRKIVAPTKSVVPVNYVIALVGEPDEPLPDVAEENREIVERHRAETAAMDAAKAAGEVGPAERPKAKPKVRAKPSARRLAREAGIDLADVPAASEGRIVTEDDVRAYLDVKEGQTS